MPWADEDETERGILYSLGQQRLLEAQGKKKLRDAYLRQKLDPLAKGERPGSDQPSEFQKYRDKAEGKVISAEGLRGIARDMEREQIDSDRRYNEGPIPGPTEMHLAEGGEVNPETGLPDPDPDPAFDENALLRRQAEALPDRPSAVMEPDLQTSQMAHGPEVHDPSKYVVDELGRVVEREKYAAGSDEAVQFTPRPGMLPLTKTPEGRYEGAMPKIADIAGNFGGGWSVPVQGAEAVLGTGLARARRMPAIAEAKQPADAVEHWAQSIADKLVEKHGEDYGAINDALTKVQEVTNSQVSDAVFGRLPQETRLGIIDHTDALSRSERSLETFFKEASPSEVEHLSEQEITSLHQQLVRAGAGPAADFEKENPKLFKALLARIDDLEHSKASEIEAYKHYEQEPANQEHYLEEPKEAKPPGPPEFHEHPDYAPLVQARILAANRMENARGTGRADSARAEYNHRSQIEREAYQAYRERYAPQQGAQPGIGHNQGPPLEPQQRNFESLTDLEQAYERQRVAQNLEGMRNNTGHPNAPLNDGQPMTAAQFFDAANRPSDVMRLNDSQLHGVWQDLLKQQEMETGLYRNIENYQPDLLDALRNRVREVEDAQRFKQIPYDPDNLDPVSGEPIRPQSYPTPQQVPRGPFHALSRDFVNYFDRILKPHTSNISEFAKKYFAGQDPKDLIGETIRDSHRGSGKTGVRISGNLRTPEGKVIGHIDREIFPEAGFAYHQFFRVDADMRDGTIAPAILRNQIDLYKQMGLKSVDLYAALESGPYAWLKYGWIPKKIEWARLTRRIRDSINHDYLHISDPDVKAEALRLLDNPDPRTAWRLADWTATDAKGNPLGPLIFLGTKGRDKKGVRFDTRHGEQNWEGSLNLEDPASLERFYRYAQRDRKKKPGK